MGSVFFFGGSQMTNSSLFILLEFLVLYFFKRNFTFAKGTLAHCGVLEDSSKNKTRWQLMTKTFYVLNGRDNLKAKFKWDSPFALVILRKRFRWNSGTRSYANNKACFNTSKSIRASTLKSGNTLRAFPVSCVCMSWKFMHKHTLLKCNQKQMHFVVPEMRNKLNWGWKTKTVSANWIQNRNTPFEP